VDISLDVDGVNELVENTCFYNCIKIIFKEVLLYFA
jgi:hypothetical protein